MKTKFTKGEWEFLGKPDGTYSIFGDKENGKGEAEFVAEVMGNDVMKNLANAELIVESVNAANKSGFTPCELLEQRNGLLEALTDLLNSYRNYINVSEEHLIKNALAAIEKTKATE